MYGITHLNNTGGRSKSKRCAIWMWVLLFTLVGPAFQLLRGQAGGGLTGTVTDPSGAAIAMRVDVQERCYRHYRPGGIIIGRTV
jgi:hypothetical protein